MDINFLSKEELFNRVKPALRVKVRELNNEYNENDIWNYLIVNKWINSNNLMLCDIVNDIIKLDKDEIINYKSSNN